LPILARLISFSPFKKQGNREQGIGNREEDLSLFFLFIAVAAALVGHFLGKGFLPGEIETLSKAL